MATNAEKQVKASSKKQTLPGIRDKYGVAVLYGDLVVYRGGCKRFDKTIPDGEEGVVTHFNGRGRVGVEFPDVVNRDGFTQDKVDPEVAYAVMPPRFLCVKQRS